MKNRVTKLFFCIGIISCSTITPVTIYNLSANTVTITINKWMGFPEGAPLSYELFPYQNLAIAQAEKCSVSNHPIAPMRIFNNIRINDMIFIFEETIVNCSPE